MSIRAESGRRFKYVAHTFELARRHPSSLTPLPSPSLSFPLFFALPFPLENARRRRRPQVRMQLRPRGPKISFFFSFSFSFRLLMSKVFCSLAAPAPPSPWLLRGGPVVASMPVQRAALMWPPRHQAVRNTTRHARHIASSTANGTFPSRPHKSRRAPALPAAAPRSAVPRDQHRLKHPQRYAAPRFTPVGLLP